MSQTGQTLEADVTRAGLKYTGETQVKHSRATTEVGQQEEEVKPTRTAPNRV